MEDYQSTYTGEEIDNGVEGGLDFVSYKPIVLNGNLKTAPINAKIGNLNLIISLKTETEVSVQASSDVDMTVKIVSERFGGQAASNLVTSYALTSTPTELSVLTYYPLVLTTINTGSHSYDIRSCSFASDFSDVEIVVRMAK